MLRVVASLFLSASICLAGERGVVVEKKVSKGQNAEAPAKAQAPQAPAAVAGKAGPAPVVVRERGRVRWRTVKACPTCQ
jgi:hypothetical protein